MPSKDCDEVKTLRPRQCRKCNARLKGKDPEPLRHQVIGLPEIKPIVTEYQQHRLTCQCCGTQTCAPLPKDVPTGQCGPRLAAFTGLLMGHFRQSKRRAASFLGDLLNVPCSPAWTVTIQNRVSDALAQPYEELRSELQNQEQLFVDESPTKQNKSKAWLWVAVTPWFAVFGIFLTRKRAALQALVGNYSGSIINCNKRLIGMCKELYKQRMGWGFEWVSSFNNEFNRDFGVTFTEEKKAEGRMNYNYRLGSFPVTECPGVSSFARNEAGEVFHTYSAYARGLENLLGIYSLLDLAPKGRDESDLPYGMAWVRYHDRYKDDSFVDPCA